MNPTKQTAKNKNEMAEQAAKHTEQPAHLNNSRTLAFVLFPNSCKLGVSAQIGSGVVRGGLEVRFHEGATRVPPGFHHGSTRIPRGSVRAAGWCVKRAPYAVRGYHLSLYFLLSFVSLAIYRLLSRCPCLSFSWTFPGTVCTCCFLSLLIVFWCFFSFLFRFLSNCFCLLALCTSRRTSAGKTEDNQAEITGIVKQHEDIALLSASFLQLTPVFFCFLFCPAFPNLPRHGLHLFVYLFVIYCFPMLHFAHVKQF